MALSWSYEQLKELERAGKTHKKAHVRMKAKAVLAVARGESRKRVAELFDLSPHTIGGWVTKYRKHGLEGFEIAEGRGRKGKADLREIQECGVQISDDSNDKKHWTLRKLSDSLPSLQGLSPSGVWRAVRRAGMQLQRKTGKLIRNRRCLEKEGKSDL